MIMGDREKEINHGGAVRAGKRMNTHTYMHTYTFRATCIIAFSKQWFLCQQKFKVYYLSLIILSLCSFCSVQNLFSALTQYWSLQYQIQPYDSWKAGRKWGYTITSLWVENRRCENLLDPINRVPNGQMIRCKGFDREG